MTRQVNLSTFCGQQAIAAAYTGCQHLAPGTTWEASQLCGSTFWNGLSTPERISAGQIISAAIDRGWLPLIKRGRSDSNHQMYERDNSPCGDTAESAPPRCCDDTPLTYRLPLEF